MALQRFCPVAAAIAKLHNCRVAARQDHAPRTWPSARRVTVSAGRRPEHRAPHKLRMMYQRNDMSRWNSSWRPSCRRLASARISTACGRVSVGDRNPLAAFLAPIPMVPAP